MAPKQHRQARCATRSGPLGVPAESSVRARYAQVAFLFKVRFWRKAAVGKQAKQNGGRYSAGLLTAPRPLRQASPSPTLQIHHILRWSMRMVPAMVFLFGHLSIM